MRKFQLQACDRANAEFKVTCDHMFFCPAGLFYRHFTIWIEAGDAVISDTDRQSLCLFKKRPVVFLPRADS